MDGARLSATHWGVGVATVQDGRIAGVAPHPEDPAPSRINENIAGSLNGDARVRRPAIRAGWLDNGPEGRGGGGRGRESFVEVSWKTALDLVAREIARVRGAHGNEAIFAGSYGWASAGRFHHAQSQLKRFLNTQGGFLRSEGNYSFNAGLVLTPHIVKNLRVMLGEATRWKVVAEHADLVVAFGGLAARNTQVSDGGIARHKMDAGMAACARRGVRFVNLSPLKGDAAETLGAEWLPPRPGTDVAVMMGLAHTLIEEGLADDAFLARYTTGYDRLKAYLLGEADGRAKTADWAADISGLAADRLRRLAREMAAGRTMITCAAGVQRTDWGEQPLWMTTALAAMLGQIGLPGGGFGLCYAVNATVGVAGRPFPWAALAQGDNEVEDFIPVATISDALLNPGERYLYDGEVRRYPDIRMVWWAGGNPFHHHQDLNRLAEAFQRPETIIVNEINWTATARHADIVLPVAAPQERLDFVAGKSDSALIPTLPLTAPAGEARVEYEIYADLARRLGDETAFTEGLTTEDWVRRLWSETRTAGARAGFPLPDWDDFARGGPIDLPEPEPDRVFLSEFREDPVGNPLPTPSGRIEIYSETIASFDLPDCPGHPVWRAPRDAAAGRYPLSLLSGQPETRLHSQLDNGAFSLSAKIQGREPVLIHPDDAAVRGIADGDVVELFNDRGRCLAGARVTDGVAKGCLFLWTGAWWDPDDDAPQRRDRHGNPNALTHDLRTSSLSQSPASHSARVDCQRFDGPPPPVTVHSQPRFRVEEDAELRAKLGL